VTHTRAFAMKEMQPMSHLLNHRLATLAIVAASAFGSGCGSEHAPDGSSEEACAAGASATGAGGEPASGGPNVGSDCVSTDENLICAPSGFPFVERAFAVDQGNPMLTEPEPGVLCVSGTAAPGEHAGFLMILFRGWSGALQPFDADAHGITQLSFAVDSLPAGGLIVDAGLVLSLDCPEYLLDCLAIGFELPRITESGATSLPLADFLQSDSASEHQDFDTRSISHIGFTVGEGAYDFCVRDFKLLNDAGDEVTP
jgi:hypothetical protein